jgi:hypothetical protein
MSNYPDPDDFPMWGTHNNMYAGLDDPKKVDPAPIEKSWLMRLLTLDFD